LSRSSGSGKLDPCAVPLECLGTSPFRTHFLSIFRAGFEPEIAQGVKVDNVFNKEGGAPKPTQPGKCATDGSSQHRTACGNESQGKGIVGASGNRPCKPTSHPKFINPKIARPPSLPSTHHPCTVDSRKYMQPLHRDGFHGMMSREQSRTRWVIRVLARQYHHPSSRSVNSCGQRSGKASGGGRIDRGLLESTYRHSTPTNSCHFPSHGSEAHRCSHSHRLCHALCQRG
jgi:hypothetical protein